MEIATSSGARAWLTAFFWLVVVFLYVPIAVLALFSLNDGDPSFPLSGFTTHWYGDVLANHVLTRALLRSLVVASASSVIAVALGVMTSFVLIRRRFVGKPVVSALVFSPLVIPYLVFGILPLLERLNVSLDEAAKDLGAGAWETFRRVTLPLLMPALISAFLVAFTLSFDEFAIASFLAGTQQTWPVYLFAQLRVPSLLPQLIAVSSVVFLGSMLLVLSAEVGRRVAERRYAAIR